MKTTDYEAIRTRLDEVRETLKGIEADAPRWGGTWYAVGRVQREVSEAIEISRREEITFGDGK